MDDYIKRTEAIQRIKDYQCRQCEDGIDNRCGSCSVRLALKLFEKVPAADVRENVRGEWIVDEKRFPQGVDWCHCSECGNRDITQNVPSINFCPNCGADMRGEKE